MQLPRHVVACEVSAARRVNAFRDVVDASEFRAGLLAGAIATACAIAVALAWHAGSTWLAWPTWLKSRDKRAVRDEIDRKSRALGVGGLAFAAASVVALDGAAGFDRVTAVPDELVVALVTLAFAGIVSAWPRLPDSARLGSGMVLSIPGAWLLAERSDVPGPAWLRTTVLVAVVVIGPLVADCDRRLRLLGAGPVLLLVTAGGIYATVPDTEQVLVVLGVALPIALLGFPWPVAALGRGGAHAAVAVMLWSAANGAVGRPASIVGALGTFGLLVTIPIGRFAGGRPGRWRDRWRGITGSRGRMAALAALVVVQVAVALYAAQVAGPEHDVTTAVLVLVPAVVVALLAGWLFAGWLCAAGPAPPVLPEPPPPPTPGPGGAADAAGAGDQAPTAIRWRSAE